MNLGLVGLGKMGNAIAYRALNCGYYYKVFGFDIDERALQDASKLGIELVEDLADLAERADIVWLMLPEGDIVDKAIEKLVPHLKDGDIIIDGGNSYYKDSIERAKRLEERGIYLLDCGVSGGLYGKNFGFSITVGGKEQAFKKAMPLIEAIAQEDGFVHVGPSGAGHYVKMVHNGIEYGILQAYAEGFNVLKNGQYKDLDLEQISKIWQNGAIIRSFILDLIHEIYEEGADFSKIGGEIFGGKTGKWALEAGHEKELKLKILEAALQMRDFSSKGGDYSTKLVALLRNKFGGHGVKEL